MALSPDRRAVLLRLFGDFTLRWFERAKHDFGGDYETAVVLMSILQANVGPVGRDAALNRLYGDRPPPDDLRAPVSLREAARTIGMKRERFRRRVVPLMAAKAIAPVADGYIVPAAAIRPASSRPHAQAVALLHRRLRRNGFDVVDLPVTDGADRWRQGVLRVMGDVVVAWAREAPAALGGDIRTASILAAVMQANDHPGVETPTEAPRPIAVNALAESLAMPRESVRRYVAALEQHGRLRRSDGGVSVAPEMLNDDALAFVEPLYGLTCELLARLAAQGATFSADYLSASG